MKFPFQRENGLIIVPVELSGPIEGGIAHLALDTGATYSMINNEIAELLGYDPAVSKERVRIVTGSGIEFTSRIVVRQLQALGLTKNDFGILCHTLPSSASIDGLLGLDFFVNTVLNIDFQNGFISVDT